MVVPVRQGPGTRLACVAALGAGALSAGLWLADLATLGLTVLPMMPREPVASPRPARGTDGPLEIARIDDAHAAECAAWLEEHGRPPAQFLLEECRRYPVVIVGEQHWERESLAFLCALLPELHRSGARCLAMEWLLAEDDERIERLVTARVYDPELALEIARHHSWRAWGWKGYADVLESAWRVNASLGAGEAKLRVVGLDLPIDLVSMALAGFGDQAIAHSTVHCRGPGEAAGPGRMGFLLAQRHPGAITQVSLHDALGRGPPGSAAESGVSEFVERLLERRGNAPLGWNVTGSPFAALRDPRHWSFAGDPERVLGDLACSYLFLAPRSRLARCDWLAGYVTARMLAENRPFYEAIGRRTGVDVRDAPSADLALSRQ
jgi:hypothetical protein